MFNENSVIVKSWVDLVLKGIYKKQQVPNLGNLREVVFSILEQEGK